MNHINQHVAGWSCMAITGPESTATRSSRPAMALFTGDVSALGVRMNAAQSTSLSRSQRDRHSERSEMPGTWLALHAEWHCPISWRVTR
jgi:hypothetical protein